MPVKVNVNVNRKVTADYQSRGYGIAIEAELPANIVDDPNALAKSSSHLFQLANDILDEQVRLAGGNTPVPTRRTSSTAPTTHARREPANGNGRTDNHRHQNSGNGNGNGNSQGRAVTAAQSRAIHKMAQKLDQDGDQWATDEFGVDGVTNLTVSQASKLITKLKQELDAQQAEGAAR